MAQPLTKTFAGRRRLAFALTLLAGAGLTALIYAEAPRPPALAGTYYLSGWILLGVCVFLALYNGRKKLTYPPLFSSASWLQIHIYVGLLSFLLFGLHVGLRVPNGPFELTLAALFLLVAGSGVVGLWITRVAPARLNARGHEVIAERIPEYRRELRERAEQLTIDSLHESETTTLADFYRDRLADFFSGLRNRWRHLLQSNRPVRQLTGELRTLHRYLDDAERQRADELEELIEAKDALDYHAVTQGLLKGWLFVHIPLTFALLLCAAVHAVLVHTFIGAGP